MMDKTFDVIVIGGGAAGLCAAIGANAAGADVAVIEKNHFVGKKILSTGNGRCNFTNAKLGKEQFFSGSPEQVERIIDAFDTQSAVDFFASIGIASVQRDGYYYPFTNRAKDVNACFALELRRRNITVFNDMTVRQIRYDNAGSGRSFFVQAKSEDGRKNFFAKCVVLAVGGLAAPKSGTTGDGYAFAESFGHTIIPTQPALVGLRCLDKKLKGLAGLRARAHFSLLVEGKIVYKETGEIQFNKDGLSGIPVLSASRLAMGALASKRDVQIELSFLPALPGSSVEELHARCYVNGWGKSIFEALEGLLATELIKAILNELQIDPDREANTLKEKEIARIANRIEHFSFRVTGSKGYEFAQTTAGGVDLSEVEVTSMESKKQEGLFLAGEILDADGICGGYNLHFAWATGNIAGTAAARKAQL